MRQMRVRAFSCLVAASPARVLFAVLALLTSACKPFGNASDTTAIVSADGQKAYGLIAMRLNYVKPEFELYDDDAKRIEDALRLKYGIVECTGPQAERSINILETLSAEDSNNVRRDGAKVYVADNGGSTVVAGCSVLGERLFGTGALAELFTWQPSSQQEFELMQTVWLAARGRANPDGTDFSITFFDFLAENIGANASRDRAASIAKLRELDRKYNPCIQENAAGPYNKTLAFECNAEKNYRSKSNYDSQRDAFVRRVASAEQNFVQALAAKDAAVGQAYNISTAVNGSISNLFQSNRFPSEADFVANASVDAVTRNVDAVLAILTPAAKQGVALALGVEVGQQLSQVYSASNPRVLLEPPRPQQLALRPGNWTQFTFSGRPFYSVRRAELRSKNSYFKVLGNELQVAYLARTSSGSISSRIESFKISGSSLESLDGRISYRWSEITNAYIQTTVRPNSAGAGTSFGLLDTEADRAAAREAFFKKHGFPPDPRERARLIQNGEIGPAQIESILRASNMGQTGVDTWTPSNNCAMIAIASNTLLSDAGVNTAYLRMAKPSYTKLKHLSEDERKKIEDSGLFVERNGDKVQAKKVKNPETGKEELVPEISDTRHAMVGFEAVDPKTGKLQKYIWDPQSQTMSPGAESYEAATKLLPKSLNKSYGGPIDEKDMPTELVKRNGKWVEEPVFEANDWRLNKKVATQGSSTVMAFDPNNPSFGGLRHRLSDEAEEAIKAGKGTTSAFLEIDEKGKTEIAYEKLYPNFKAEVPVEPKKPANAEVPGAGSSPNPTAPPPEPANPQRPAPSNRPSMTEVPRNDPPSPAPIPSGVERPNTPPSQPAPANRPPVVNPPSRPAPPAVVQPPPPRPAPPPKAWMQPSYQPYYPGREVKPPPSTPRPVKSGPAYDPGVLKQGDQFL